MQIQSQQVWAEPESLYFSQVLLMLLIPDKGSKVPHEHLNISLEKLLADNTPNAQPL